MASTCPNCGKKLHWYNVKAECSQCGVSIPNFNWEARLEEDNQLAEKKFSSFYRALNRLAYSIWGTKLRVARIILSFLPAIGFILPWATLKSDSGSIGVDMFGLTSDKSLIDVFSDFFGNISLYVTNMKYENFSGVLSYSMISVLFMLLSAVFIVVAFFLILITAKHSKTKAMVVFDILSTTCAILSAVMFTLATKAAPNEIGINFGTIPVYNASGSVAWGFYVAVVLLVVATVANALVAKAPAKSDDELEAERLAKKEAKEAEEKAKEIEREKARIEEEKRAAEEQARIVEEAKAKLAAQEAKKN